jgi:riboflavin synthase
MVNLERAMKVGDRLGGHLVQGHVDAVGQVRDVTRRESALLLDIDVPQEVGRLLVPHGSITVDGVSLTVNRLPAPGVLQVSLIEWTEQHTTLGRLRPGDRVHLEADVIGKYVQALLAPYQAP